MFVIMAHMSAFCKEIIGQYNGTCKKDVIRLKMYENTILTVPKIIKGPLGQTKG